METVSGEDVDKSALLEVLGCIICGRNHMLLKVWRTSPEELKEILSQGNLLSSAAQFSARGRSALKCLGCCCWLLARRSSWLGGSCAAGRLSLEEPSLEFGDLLVSLRQPAQSLSRSDCVALRRSLALAVSA